MSCKQSKNKEVEIQEIKIRIDSLNKSYSTKGEKIFLDSCSSCHRTKRKTDYLLRGILQSLGEPYVKLYITKQDSLIQSKNKLTLAIKEEYGNMGNSHNFKFDDEQLKSITEYLK